MATKDPSELGKLKSPVAPGAGTFHAEPSGISHSRGRLLHKISRQLLAALGGLFGVMVIFCWAIQSHGPGRSGGFTAIMTFFIGCLGGYVSLQRRLGAFAYLELELIAKSWIYAMIAPLVGGILALLTLFIFVGKLLTGPLFPTFSADPAISDTGFISVFMVSAEPEHYGKLIVWAFIAGYSERFVLDVLGQFERKTVDNNEPAAHGGISAEEKKKYGTPAATVNADDN